MTQAETVARLRALGLKMGGRYPSGTVVGWTTDEEKAKAAREEGAIATEYASPDPAFAGWEIVVHPDPEPEE
jgi:hypothetical protein